MARRGSGILLHITSLPSPYGIGDLGPSAYAFADFLLETKQAYWQILPLSPTDPVRGNSPYSCASAFAGNSLVISPDQMIQDGLLTEDEVEPFREAATDQVDYAGAIECKKGLLQAGYHRFRKRGSKTEYQRFCAEHASWLEDFAAFVAIKAHFGGGAWGEWPAEIRQRQKGALASLKSSLSDEIERDKFVQFLFFKQWSSLKEYCNAGGIRIIGDVPIYVSDDSADAWSNPDIFKLDEEKRPIVVAGVPPDYFSKTGQLWGNPLYRWDVLKENRYSWWVERMAHALNLFDIVRIDHFRGFAAYWEVPAGEKTAVNGRWVEAPAADFFETLARRFPRLPIVAEDLGVITPDVREIMRRFEFPGMKVLLFAFGDDNPRNPYLPHNYSKNCVVYTGTHDNNTVRGWFEAEARPEEKKRLLRYLGCEAPAQALHRELIRLAMMSVANTAIFPMQDVLGLGDEARMNRPSVTNGNWGWRLMPEQMTSALRTKLLEMTEVYGRSDAGGE
jgi:4-alpha-glucanotransferase